jgi:general stress protein YciG
MAQNEKNDKNKGDMSVSEAGQKGGQRTAETHGSEFYSEIGHKGGQKGGERVRDLVEKGKETEEEE